MELVELLDKIDVNAPRSCETCRHMATHKKCGGCLHSPGDNILTDPFPFRYNNWEPGNWLRDLQLAEQTGRQNIVIGGAGEAEVNAKDSPHQTAKNLHRVAKCCGYSVGRLHHLNGGKQIGISVHTHEGSWRVVWDICLDNTRLAYIWRMDENNRPVANGRYWPRFVKEETNV